MGKYTVKFNSLMDSLHHASVKSKSRKLHNRVVWQLNSLESHCSVIGTLTSHLFIQGDQISVCVSKLHVTQPLSLLNNPKVSSKYKQHKSIYHLKMSKHAILEPRRRTSYFTSPVYRDSASRWGNQAGHLHCGAANYRWLGSHSPK